MKITRILLLLLSFQFLTAQEKVLREKSSDVFDELSGEFTLRIYNALTGNAVSNARIIIEASGEFLTDGEGIARFPVIETDGKYPFTVSAEGFVTSELDFEVMAGSIFMNRYSISPALDMKYVRIVLDWGKSPADLDAHLLKEGGYHISYRTMRSAADGSAALDIDDRDGEGPETITVKEVNKNSSYTFFVHDFSNNKNSSSKALSKSGAMVKVYGDGRMLKSFRIPADQPGTKWDVFKIENGGVLEINHVSPN